ncbi:MAG: M15 family metallopeptidase [Bacillota bacterium]|nr:M15 family metallopeptidase [Bacillota bacterium]
MKKLLMITVALLIILTGCKTVIEDPDVDLPEVIEKDPKITGINISPEKVLAGSGEEVEFKVEAILEGGKTIDITSDMKFRTDTEKISFENNKALVGEDAITGEEHVVVAEYIGAEEVDIDLYATIEIFNSLEDTIDENGVITNPDAYDMVVNKERNLSSEYVPNDLVKLEVETCLPNPEINQLRKAASDAITEMFKTAEEEEGLNLVARSGYRSYATQDSLYHSIVNNHGQDYADKYSAYPGQSEHQTGLALDITAASVSYQLEDVFGETEEGIWTRENAHRFGFIIRYPEGKEDITGYLYEPWHLRYVGKNLADKIYRQDTTLEEYFTNKEE